MLLRLEAQLLLLLLTLFHQLGLLETKLKDLAMLGELHELLVVFELHIHASACDLPLLLGLFLLELALFLQILLLTL